MRASFATWALVIVSFVAALIAFAFTFNSFALANDVLAADPHCAGVVVVDNLLHAQSALAQLHTAWLVSGVSGAIGLSCAVLARRIASETPQVAQRTAHILLALSSLALLGPVVSFAWFQIAQYANCIG